MLLEFPRKGIMTIGFVTEEMVVANGKKFYTVFVPQSPIPAAGFVEIVDEGQITPTNLSVEHALRTIVSLGRVFPEGVFDRPGSIA
jgi:uncharacterized membrane protein